MRVVFRSDAGAEIGHGHIMRCLTLAHKLKEKGHSVQFVCVNIKGHLAEKISQSFSCYLINKTDWLSDAEQTNKILENQQIDWLVVDHYRLDYRWHKQLRDYIVKIMVIDDLANRQLDCDLLLDTGLGKMPEDYQGLVPERCQILTGIKYALIRDEFISSREAAKKKRKQYTPYSKLLINFGGIDTLGVIPKLLEELHEKLPLLQIMVVVSSATPNLTEIKQQADNNANCRLITDAENMAEIMLEADLAIGAGGVTALERCVMGLPSIVLAVAENQQHFVTELARNNAVMFVEASENIALVLVDSLANLLKQPERLKMLSRAGFNLLDGGGAEYVASFITS